MSCSVTIKIINYYFDYNGKRYWYSTDFEAMSDYSHFLVAETNRLPYYNDLKNAVKKYEKEIILI